MKLRYLKSTSSDLKHIIQYIAQDNPTAARDVRTRIEQSLLILPQHPEIGRKTDHETLRKWSIPALPYSAYSALKLTKLLSRVSSMVLANGQQSTTKPNHTDPAGGETCHVEPMPADPAGGETRSVEPKPADPAGGETRSVEPKPADPAGGETRSVEPKLADRVGGRRSASKKESLVDGDPQPMKLLVDGDPRLKSIVILHKNAFLREKIQRGDNRLTFGKAIFAPALRNF